MQELGLFHITAHDLADKSAVAVAVSVRVIFRRRDLREPVLGTVAPELHRAEIEGAVGAVEQEAVTVELLHGDGICALGIGKDRDPHMAALPFPAEIDVAFALMLIVDVQRIPHKRIGQSLAKLHRFQRPGVGDPSCAVIDVPLLALRDEPGDVLEHVCEQSAIADVVPRIAVILRWGQFTERLLKIIEIVHYRGPAHGLIELRTHRHSFFERGRAVIIPFPLVSHQC